jgi:hypothetical protein
MALRTVYIRLKDKVIEKITGAVLTENNYTDAEKTKLAGLSGGTLTPEQIAAIAAQIDLSGKMNVTAFSGLSKITVGATEPVAPSVGDIWISTV